MTSQEVNATIRQSLGLSVKPEPVPTVPQEGHVCDFPIWLSDSNRTILDAKELRLVLQWVVRCPSKRRLMRHDVKGSARRLPPSDNLSAGRLNKDRLINLLWAKVHGRSRRHLVGSKPLKDP